MIIDLTHNKIVRATISDRFKESVDEVLIPLLREKYGDTLLGIQMYEDYLADNFAVGKEWYYPLTLVTDGGIKVEWISWSMKKGEFEGDVPYAYVGKDALAFSLTDNVPAEFDARLEGRAHYFEGGTVKVRVETTATDVTVLSGRYSQTFVDEMARQLTGLLERTMEVSGIADSSIEIAIVFTPDTYLEHTSENVTYRRLLIVDKSSSPRDLWIKWTRTDGCGAYSASDSVTADSIVFELGENVSQKVREKEYRFLLRASKERYHKSMGRKNITEWRDVLKRAVRRGDLDKTGGEDLISKAEAKAAAEATEAAAKETAAVEETAAVPETVEMTEDEELALAMEMARRAMDSVNNDDEIVDDDADEEDEELDELDAFYAEDTAEVGSGVVTDDEDEQRELAEITRLAMEALKFAAEQDEEEEKEAPAFVSFGDEAEETVETYSEIEEIVDDEELEDDDTLEDVRALEPNDEPATVEASVAPAPEKTTVIVEKTVGTAELEAKIRDELEAKIRLEYETRARERAEEEAERLRREQEQLRLENERLQDRARREKAEWTRIEENRRAETEKLRTQIEAQVRQEAKERERLAEAARAAVEEQHRLEAEKLRQERQRLEEERRADAERRRAEEEARIEAARRAEAERIRRSEETEKPAEEPQYVDNDYTYVSKTVRLIFRRSVDPNITARIHEIIKATLEYYGKEKVYMRIKATVPDTSTVCLEFVKIPLEEMELLSNIIKVIGNSGLGIAKAILE
jgi:hypothetical protein